jgi:hypothetical protein
MGAAFGAFRDETTERLADARIADRRPVHHLLA